MPQMAPLMWLNLLFSTFMIIVVLMVYNYFFKSTDFNTKEISGSINMSKKWLW